MIRDNTERVRRVNYGQPSPEELPGGGRHERRGGSSQHAGRLTLTGQLTHHDVLMTEGSNAGIKRNRLPGGTKLRRFNLAPTTDEELQAVCKQSGNVSRSLYLEQLIALVKAEHGSLPVFSPALDGTEVHIPAA